MVAQAAAGGEVFQDAPGRLIYPDVYCLALMLADKFDFLLEGEKVAPGKYDVIFAELQSSESQLRYLESLVEAQATAGHCRFPGRRRFSPAISPTRSCAREAHPSGGASSGPTRPNSRRFAMDSSAAIAPPSFRGLTIWRPHRSWDRARRPGRLRKILVQAPMSFHDIVQNHPFMLKGVLLDVWQELPAGLRDQLSFHTTIYNSTDVERYQSSGFADGLPFVLDGKLGYRAFVRFLGRVRRRRQSHRGQHSWTHHVSLRRARASGNFQRQQSAQPRLYPHSTVAMFDTVHCVSCCAPCCWAWPTAEWTRGFCHRRVR